MLPPLCDVAGAPCAYLFDLILLIYALTFMPRYDAACAQRAATITYRHRQPMPARIASTL